ncbi:hypothetical protein [Oxalobacter paraformigenes]|uniref:Uncharacterized protein n=1 Tax=Oxalobacter paraformigenes TaxID=556268 RepID=T5LUF4_9BURK|nr:hypothetical protein [Oxalobacter paraformigenes]EQM95118.1 hypothetical protein OFAG_02342 [Oxalobacter paraformigenes]
MKNLKILLAAFSVMLFSANLYAVEYQHGYCHVRQTAPDVCQNVKGYRVMGSAIGNTHDDCTTAKNAARDNLIRSRRMQAAPAVCRDHIDCGGPCETVGG